MTSTQTTTTTYTYPRVDFTIVGSFHVAYENSAKSGSSGIAMFSPIAVRNDSLTDDDHREAAYDHAMARAMVKFDRMTKRGAAERVCVFVASGDNDRQRFTLADADALARFVALNDLRPVAGVTPRWFQLARAGLVADAVAAAPVPATAVTPWSAPVAPAVAHVATEAPLLVTEDQAGSFLSGMIEADEEWSTFLDEVGTDEASIMAWPMPVVTCSPEPSPASHT